MSRTIDAWLEDYLDAKGVQKIAAEAKSAARFLRAEDAGAIEVVDFSPGNGFRYLMILNRVQHPGLAGELLVALPEFNVCALLDPHAMHVPTYIEETMHLGAQHSAVIAACTTLLSDHLRDYPVAVH